MMSAEWNNCFQEYDVHGVCGYKLQSRSNVVFLYKFAFDAIFGHMSRIDSLPPED